MHTIEPMDFLTHQKMSERMLSPALQNMDAAQAAKRQRVEANSQGPNYDHLPVNFFPVDTTVVVSKAEYELMRQEVVNLKQTLNEFRSSVEAELEQLKKENKLLKSQVARCTCGCRTRPANQNQTNDKSSEDDSNLQTSFDKSVEDDAASPPRGYAELLERENKSLQQKNHELEKQLHQLRATSSRAPPIPSSQAMTFFRELVAYYTLLESGVDSGPSANGKTTYNAVNSIDNQQDKASSFGGMGFDPHMFATNIPSSCSIYGNMPEAFDVEKGLQVQLLPNYNVWVSKSKLQLILKEASSVKEGAQLFVLRRLIPLVFTWEELAASRGQGLNCKSTDDILTKDPLDPTKVLVCKAYMRKFCLESGQPEPPEKSINETFSHQVNYARRKFKRGKVSDVIPAPHDESHQGINDDSFNQSQCQDNNNPPHLN